MWWDNPGLSLALHGDTYERESWRRHQQQLSGYESIWLKYVVPLTNRIDSRISPKDDNWIMLRRVSHQWQHFAMANYSTLYYFCRAKDLQATAPQFYEALFNYLRMCTYNLFALLESCDEILGQHRVLTGIVTGSAICTTIKRYRDILLKNPVVGRSRIIGRGSLPNEAALVRLTAHKTERHVDLGGHSATHSSGFHQSRRHGKCLLSTFSSGTSRRVANNRPGFRAASCRPGISCKYGAGFHRTRGGGYGIARNAHGEITGGIRRPILMNCRVRAYVG